MYQVKVIYESEYDNQTQEINETLKKLIEDGAVILDVQITGSKTLIKYNDLNLITAKLVEQSLILNEQEVEDLSYILNDHYEDIIEGIRFDIHPDEADAVELRVKNLITKIKEA